MKRICTTLLSFCALAVTAQNPSPIRVNQVGYFPNEEKTATIEPEGRSKKYTITNEETGKTVWKGKATRTAESPFSAKTRDIIDFSSITTPGTYTINAGKQKQTITIKEHVFSELAVASMKSFYLQRMSEPILSEYAGQYARPAAHMDTNVLVHESAATEERPAGTTLNCTGGWYDAGDYNKYIVNSAFTIGIMLDAYMLNKEYFDNMNLNIPESNNSTPDFLDEIMVNLRWMQTMQDPNDGGVYHKLTTPNFEGFIMPTECKQQRYVVQKTTCATLDFAACMALASRIYRQFPEYKDWADKALKQAEAAYEWAEKNPKIFYLQNEMNKQFKPEITTGAYDDMNAKDEFLWAQVEIALASNNFEAIENIFDDESVVSNIQIPVWGNVGTLALYSAVGYLEQAGMLNRIVSYAGPYVQQIMDQYVGNSINLVPTSCYTSPYGNKAEDFGWGSNAEGCCGKGIALLYAYRLTNDKKYLTAALEVADYLLGRNATGYCFVTGFGNFSPKYPHQRLSHADGIEEPLPGFLVGGPNPGQQDIATCNTYTSNFPDESYTDDTNSYASNEIAINWNASLVAFICWLDAEMK